jgi:hypothetical protein
MAVRAVLLLPGLVYGLNHQRVQVNLPEVMFADQVDFGSKNQDINQIE